MFRLMSLLAAAAAVPSLALAAPPMVSEVVVVSPTPLAGGGVDRDKLPGVVESLSAEAFQRTNSLSVTDALEQRLPGASLSDTQGNTFTRDFNFRGFKASPLQGSPQGFAVYMGGVRLNEAFGDTVNWDLVPEIAISGADLFTSNPAFGLNAIGGAITLRMKTGFLAQRGSAEVQGGSFGRLYGSAEDSYRSGPIALYLAADGGHETGWRGHSPSDVARAYGDLGWRSGPAELHLVMAGASNSFGVVGPTPVDLLAQDRRAVFTFPQATRNTTGLVALNGRYELGGGWSLQGAAYARRFLQHHVDGNGADLEGCSRQPANPLFNTLCIQDDAFPSAIRPPAASFQVQTLAGIPIGCPARVAGQTKPCNGIPYGSIDRTRTAADTLGASLQASRSGTLLGRGNAFSVGASLDDSRVRFSSASTLGLIRPDLRVEPSGVTGAGQVIRTAGAIAYSPVEARTRTTYLGLYATDTLDVTDRLSLTLSGRFNRALVSLADLTGDSPSLNGRHVFNRFNPAAGLAYKIAAGVTGYLSYAEANRAPTALELGCSDPLRPCLLENALVADPVLKQVTAATWEAGLRGSSTVGDGRMHWRIGAFQTDNHDDILPLASVIQGRGFYTNVPATRRKGLEASLEYATPRLMAYAGLSHVEATYRFAGELPAGSSPFADDSGKIHVQTGDRIGGIPADRFKAGGDFAVTSQVTLSFDALAIGRQFLVGDEANQDRPLPGYWTVGANVSWRANEGVEVFARIENLLDSHRASYGTYFQTDALQNLGASPLPADPNPRSVTPMTPRAIQIGLRAHF